MQILYNIATVLLAIMAIPLLIIRAIREDGFIERIKQSLGNLPKHALDAVEKKQCIWVHAASVGEIVAASPLIKEFRIEFPNSPILVSVVTSSGYAMANRIVKDADTIIYFPLDLPWIAESLVKKVQPRVFLPVETELWPNFLKAARRFHIPVMMVNGRISDKSVKRYHHLHSLLKDMIGTVNTFAMQSDIDAQYIVRLGAAENLVTVTGNTKFDQTYTNVSLDEKQQMIFEMGLTNATGILLAGSTHKGEENHILEAFRQLRKKFPMAKLVIAPRDIMRKDEIMTLCQMFQFKVKTRTELQTHPATDHDVVILDTIGELGKVYSVGDVIYVGGSLIPHGGHNILEPAAHGKAIIVGNKMFNFKDTHALFSKRNACITVENQAQLGVSIENLFRDSVERCRMEQETLAIMKENRGAARKSAVLLHELLNACEQRQNSGIVKSTEKIENFQTYLYQLVHGRAEHGILSQFAISILYSFSFIYHLLVNFKLAGYRWGILKQQQLACHVISLGNITVGGTGKTPTAQRLARAIRDMGYRVVILNRGYRAKWKGQVGVVSDGKKLYMSAAEAGDEAFLLAKNLPNVPVLIGAERAITGQYAVEHFGAEVAILDDGYQHWQLKRDMDILLIDAINVFGNSYMLPRGTLREPVTHLDRADVCLMTKVDQAAPGVCEQIKETVAKYNEHALIVESIHLPRCFIEVADWDRDIAAEGIDISYMHNKKVMAVSAIGNPASFEQTISDIGAVIVESLRYPDHHDYTTEEMQDVFRQSLKQGVEAIIITEKDAVKIPNEIIHADHPIPIYVISIEITFQEGDLEFHELLSQSLKKKLGK
ncbi:lipid-A-disaccharide kinase [Propionispira arboris]|uniref:Tetraacyldisaccharide 4'-kinase n=1 Tax=Propionispira arboris TaxID=84035 RepID=A0A1H6TS82_9FIRM|nr:tetraacyldisaccharide 4'-kinase [Propionispira arboris]SEI82919.1 lipid-A-disaccharide kinase [Propionispira arboris]